MLAVPTGQSRSYSARGTSVHVPEWVCGCVGVLVVCSRIGEERRGLERLGEERRGEERRGACVWVCVCVCVCVCTLCPSVVDDCVASHHILTLYQAVLVVALQSAFTPERMQQCVICCPCVMSEASEASEAAS